MQRFLLLVVCFALGFVQPMRAQSSSGDPSDLFLNAYMAVQQGERAEQEGNVKQSLAKYRFAASLLEQIQQKYPNWQPLIVEYRKKRTTENISRLEQQASGEAPVIPAPPAVETEAPLPKKEETTAAPMPEKSAPPVVTSEASSEIKSRMDQLQKELRESREQLSAVQHDKEQLAGQLDDALKQIDKSKIGVAELKAKLQQTQEALKNQSADNSQDAEARQAMQKQIARLQDQLADTQADREASDAVNSDYTRRLAKVRKTATAAAKEQEAANAKVKDLEAKYASASKLAGQLEATKAEVAKLTQENQASHQNNEEAAEKLADAQKQLTAIGKDREAARKQVEDLNKKVSDAQKQIAAVGAERDSIAKQRDQALAELAQAREAQKKVDKLIADNASLAQKLGDAEKTIQQFQTDGPMKEQQIANLRKEVGETKELLAATQKQNGEYQTSIANLQKQLDSANSAMAEMQASTANDAEKKKYAEENDLLRGIVLRQLKEQARREQAKKLVVSELQRLEVQSGTLMQQIHYLGQPVVKLTDKERSLFKQPQLDIAEAEAPAATPAPGLELSIAAPKPDSTPMMEATHPAASSSPVPAAVTKVSPTEMAKLNSASSPTISPNGKTNEEPLPAKESTTDTSAPASTGSDAVNPNVPEDLLTQAHDAKDQFDRGNYRDAEKTYEKMLTKAPNNVYILSNLGVVDFRQNKMKLAEEKFKKAIAVAPEDSFSHRTLGIVYYQQGKFDEAVNSLTKAVAINPKDGIAHNYLGITASQKGWQEAALKELETAIALDPNYADANFNLAVIYATMQPPNKQSAQKYYKRATELGAEPDSALEQLIK